MEITAKTGNYKRNTYSHKQDNYAKESMLYHPGEMSETKASRNNSNNNIHYCKLTGFRLNIEEIQHKFQYCVGKHHQYYQNIKHISFNAVIIQLLFLRYLHMKISAYLSLVQF